MKRKLTQSLILLTFMLAACGGPSTQAESQPAGLTKPTTASPIETTASPTEAAAPATEASTSSGASFANDVMPILAGSCTECHGGNQTKAGLNMTTYEGLMAGSFNGAVVVPGDSAGSVLVQFVAEGKMPKRGPKLTPEQVKVISDWVAAGASNN